MRDAVPVIVTLIREMLDVLSAASKAAKLEKPRLLVVVVFDGDDGDWEEVLLLVVVGDIDNDVVDGGDPFNCCG